MKKRIRNGFGMKNWWLVQGFNKHKQSWENMSTKWERPLTKKEALYLFKGVQEEYSRIRLLKNGKLVWEDPDLIEEDIEIESV